MVSSSAVSAEPTVEDTGSLGKLSPAKPSTTATRKDMSSAMKFYLKKKRENDMFIAKERSEFELGKKHLANMMGMTYETMTQQDVDTAIDYLFPSGLTYKDARPHMKPPEEVQIATCTHYVHNYVAEVFNLIDLLSTCILCLFFTGISVNQR